MTDKKQPTHTMLYKHRGEDGQKNPEAWNLPLDTKVVEDGEIEAHQGEGWLTAAEVHTPKAEGDAKPRGRRGHTAD